MAVKYLSAFPAFLNPASQFTVRRREFRGRIFFGPAFPLPAGSLSRAFPARRSAFARLLFGSGRAGFPVAQASLGRLRDDPSRRAASRGRHAVALELAPAGY